jgi:hypothetical protein
MVLNPIAKLTMGVKIKSLLQMIRLFPAESVAKEVKSNVRRNEHTDDRCHRT